jgi:hypothetical protein
MSETLAAGTANSNSTAGGTFELMTRAARDGAADAREAAAHAWERTSLFMSRFVYTTCYTVSYGVVFPSALLAQSIPRDSQVARGFAEGARAARLKVDQLLGTA